jgi:hypothetical protein
MHDVHTGFMHSWSLPVFTAWRLCRLLRLLAINSMRRRHRMFEAFFDRTYPWCPARKIPSGKLT